MLLSAIKQHSKYDVINISPSPLVLRKPRHDAAIWLDAEFKLNPRCISSAIWRKVLEFRDKGLGEEREDTRVIDPKGGTMISSIVVTVPTRGGTHYTQYWQTESSYWITSQEMLNMRWVFYNFSPLLKYQNIFAIFVTALFF